MPETQNESAQMGVVCGDRATVDKPGGIIAYSRTKRGVLATECERDHAKVESTLGRAPSTCIR